MLWYGRARRVDKSVVERAPFDLESWLAEHHVGRWVDPVCVPAGTSVAHGPARRQVRRCSCNKALRVGGDDVLVCVSDAGSHQAAALYRLRHDELRFLPPELPVSSTAHLGWELSEGGLHIGASLEVEGHGAAILLTPSEPNGCWGFRNVKRLALATFRTVNEQQRAEFYRVLGATDVVCAARGRYLVHEGLVREPARAPRRTTGIPDPSEDLVGWLRGHQITHWEEPLCVPIGVEVPHDTPTFAGRLPYNVALTSEACQCDRAIRLGSTDLLVCSTLPRAWPGGYPRWHALYRVVKRRLVPVLPRLLTAAQAYVELSATVTAWLSATYKLTVEGESVVYEPEPGLSPATLADASDCESIAGEVQGAPEIVFPPGTQWQRAEFLQGVAQVVEVCNSRGRYRYVDGRLVRDPASVPAPM